MYKFLIPFRFFLRRRISYLAVLAVMLCVFIVVVVMTVMMGLTEDFSQKNHAFVGDCVVGTDSLVGFSWYEDFISRLEGTDFVAGACPVIQTFGLVKSELTSNNAALPIMGIDLGRHLKVTAFGEGLYYRASEPGSAFVPGYAPSLPGCVLGVDLLVERQSNGEYSQLADIPRWSFSITCFPLTAKGALVKSGLDVSANTKVFYYSDNVQTGIAKVDSGMVFVSFDDLQSLCSMGGPVKRASSVFIKFVEGVDLFQGTAKVAAMWDEFAKEYSGRGQGWLLAGVSVKDWKTYRREIIAPMEKEQTMMLLLFIMVGVITVFIIFVVFYMLISHKSKDIGILKSLGVSDSNVLGLFIGFAVMIGFTGALLGICFSLVFLAKVNELEDWMFARFGWQLWNREVYAIGDIPNRASMPLLVVVFLSALLVCVLGAFFPTLKGARKKCVDILRVNGL